MLGWVQTAKKMLNLNFVISLLAQDDISQSCTGTYWRKSEADDSKALSSMTHLVAIYLLIWSEGRKEKEAFKDMENLYIQQSKTCEDENFLEVTKHEVIKVTERWISEIDF